MSSVSAPSVSGVHPVLINALAALMSQPPRPRFEDTPEGQAFAKVDPALLPALQGVITERRTLWEKSNGEDINGERILACAHIVAQCDPESIGSVCDTIKARALTLAGLVNVTKSELCKMLVDNDAAGLAPFAEAYARSTLATDAGKVAYAEAARIVKLSPACKAMFGNLLADNPKVERVYAAIPAKGNAKAIPERKEQIHISAILSPLARDWAKANNFEVVPEPKADASKK